MPSADEIRDRQRANWAGLSAGWEKWDSVIIDWHDGAMINLGTVDGDANSTAVWVNDHDQVVGDSSGEHGWLWQDGSIHDLNTLIAPGSGLTMTAAASINNRGDIYGTAVLPNGDQHVVLLVPRNR